MALKLAMFALVATISAIFIAGSNGVSSSYSGPRFSKEPPAKVEFVSSKGTTIDCAATGNPPPKVYWTLIDGSQVPDIAGLRKMENLPTESSSLVLSPFKAENFRPDVHSAVYRCIASNLAGLIHSRNVNVHGVVLHNHEVLVYDSYAIEGNSAVFKCHVSAVLKDYVTVTAWIKNDNLLIQPTSAEVINGKFAVMPSGELHIHDVSLIEMGSRFKCKAHNRLTGETLISSSDGQLFVTESRGVIAPKIFESVNSVSVEVGQLAVLACVSQGSPLPSVNWYKRISKNSNRTPINFVDRFVKTDSAMMIKNVETQDSGIYTCEALNNLGMDDLDIEVTVAVAFSVKMEPSVHKVDIGEKVTLDCVTTGKVQSVLWLHNGLPMESSSGINLFIESVQITDRGMYQCFVKNSAGDLMQATSELLLSEIPPYFLEVYESITLHPGGSVTLKCVSNGIPLPTISWNIDGIPLNTSSRLNITSSEDRDDNVVGMLHLGKVVVQDGGLYSCVASSNSGRTIHSARINVFGELGVRIVPHILAVAGDNLLLNCPIYGYPLPSIVWEKDGQELRSSRKLKFLSNGTLYAEQLLKKSGAGSYTCLAQATNGKKIKAEVQVTVMVAPKIVPFEFQDELLREGMRARLQCVVSDGDLPLTVTWLKDGKPLSPELGVLVRVLDEFSSILTINSIIPGHNGKYTCVASNRAATVTHSAELSVNVPPKVVPFSFQDEHLAEGQLARVSCVVSRGDLPLKLLWEKDGVSIGKETLGITGFDIKSFDDHSSILSITGVTPEHNGLYTCIASNGAGSSRHSAQLTVNVPPQWVVYPKDVSILKGEDVMLHCSVRGFPKPVISWMKVTGSSLEQNFTPLRSGQNLQLLPNGSLSITNAGITDVGYYYCEAVNGIGDDLNKQIKLDIFAPPIFKHGLSEEATSLGEKAQLQCLIKGDPPLKITWVKDGKPLQEGHSRLIIETTSTASESRSLLTIHKAAREDSANFSCIAENSFGTNTSFGKLLVIEPPNAPLEFKAETIESRLVELSWQASFDGNNKIKKYLIQHKLESDSWEDAKSMETMNGEPTSGIISQLQPATDYIFRLFAENSQGRSPASQILRLTTAEDVPSGFPRDLQVEPVNVETFKVFWKAPEEDLWNGKILGYYVGYKETEGDDRYLFKTLMTREPNADDLYVQIGGLKQFTKYSVVVLAYNSKGKGPQTEPVVIMTSEGAPTLPPTAVRCTPLTPQTIHVTFIAPPVDSVSGILRGYKVIYKPMTEKIEDLLEETDKTNITSITLSKLEKFMNYSIEVQASTRAGDSPRSPAVHCKTLDDVPGAPIDIKALVASENSVTVSWKNPENTNGVLRSFIVHWKDNSNEKDVGSSRVVSHLYYHEVSRLQTGRQYEFWVTASTLVGEGLPSKTVLQTPSGPKIAAKIVSFEDKVVTPWKMEVQLPCLAVGNPEPTRNWYRRGNLVDITNKVKMSADGSLVLKDVQDENSGDYTCSVQNEVGEDKITYTVIILSPPTEVPLKVSAISSNAINLKWIAPVTKMTKIKGYTLKVKRVDGKWKEIIVNPEVSEHKINNLDCGTQYEVTIVAHNKIGSSAPSEIIALFTNGSVPISPSKTDMIEETSSSVSLYLNTWKNNGCPIENYIVEYAPKSSNEWTIVSRSVKPEQRRLVIPSLKSGIRYGLRMTARNSAGSTVAMYEFATLTASGGTISPDVQGDEPYGRVDSLMTQLNFYLIVPLICTAVILLAIMGVACMCMKLKKTDRRTREVNQRLSAAALYELKRADNAESFNYMQHGSVYHRSSMGTGKHAPNDITPYATLQLVNHGNQTNTLGRQCSAPPLPPPRFDGFGCDGSHMMDSHFFQPSVSGFVPGNQGQMTETTFVFPVNQMGESPVSTVNSFPPGYKNESQK